MKINILNEQITSVNPYKTIQNLVNFILENSDEIGDGKTFCTETLSNNSIQFVVKTEKGE